LGLKQCTEDQGRPVTKKKGIMEQAYSGYAELSVSDYSQLRPFQDYLGSVVPDVRVSRIAGRAGAGEQGALDVLAVLAGSSGLVAVIRVLPEFLRSRKTGLSVTMTVRGELFTLTATNIDEVMPVLERLLDA
jgi:hypothetical protein